MVFSVCKHTFKTFERIQWAREIIIIYLFFYLFFNVADEKRRLVENLAMYTRGCYDNYKQDNSQCLECTLEL